MCGRWEGGLQGRKGGGGVQKLQKIFFFSKFQKIVIIPKNINLEKNIFRNGGVAGGRGCGKGGGGVQKLHFFPFFKISKKIHNTKKRINLEKIILEMGVWPGEGGVAGRERGVFKNYIFFRFSKGGHYSPVCQCYANLRY